MFKKMLRPGITAGVIGGVVSILVSVLLVLALLLPGQVGITLYCMSSPVGLLLSLGIGLLAAFLAQRRSPEKLTANMTAPAGVIAGVVSTLIGIIAVPFTQQMPNWLGLQDKMIEVQLAPSRLMGLSGEQLEMARAQIIAMQKSGFSNTTMLAGLATGLVCGLVFGVALGAGGAALGALIFKPSLRRKLLCQKCQALFELGGNAFVEVKAEGAPDLVDYCNWADLAPDTAKQQRAVIAEVLNPPVTQNRQWQCGMCKTVQAY
jgi:hypothetical protein